MSAKSSNSFCNNYYILSVDVYASKALFVHAVITYILPRHSDRVEANYVVTLFLVTGKM